MAAAIMRVVSIGVHKFMVRSIVVREMIHLTNGKDFSVMQAVIDIHGLNDISREILSQAAGCICGTSDTLWQWSSAALNSMGYPLEPIRNRSCLESFPTLK
ncbi:MAG: Tm-1-like ATP-binding domain-containing protein [Syntrophaceae bacterium]|nr:Tm-1-like ATP-binding domain-containing protein [Syntrophaceae bacterium]